MRARLTGLPAWWVQRVSAICILAFVVLSVGALSLHPHPSYAQWKAWVGSPERLEYTVVGDTVNLSQRLQDLARPAGTTVFSEATAEALGFPPEMEPMDVQQVKGRDTPVQAFKIEPTNGGS